MDEHPRAELELDREPNGLSPEERARVRAHVAECPACRLYAEELARNDALLSRREALITPPPLRSRRQPDAVWLALGAAAAMLFVVVTAFGIARDSVVTARPSATIAPSASASVGPAVSQPPSGTTTQPTATASATPSVQPSGAQAAFTGNWMFVGKLIRDPAGAQSKVEIWGIPVDTGTARLVYSFGIATTGVPEVPLDNTPYLRRQFSPDGTQLVLSVSGQLVIVDLGTGRSRSLGVSGAFPSWSRDGGLIAFTHPSAVTDVVPRPISLAVVSPAGGTMRDLGVISEPRQSAEWSPDGHRLLMPVRGGVAVVDVASGRVLRTLATVTVGSPSFAQWRASAPELVIAGYACDRGNALLVSLDDAAASERTLVDPGESCDRVGLRDPRWNPAGASEVLYVRARHGPGIEAFDYTVHVFDAASGRDSALPLTAYEATWSRTGTQIAYIVKSTSAPYGTAVALASRADPSVSRELLRAEAGAVFFSIASVGY